MSTNWTIEKYKAVDLADKIKNKKIKVPHYQRGQVWKEKQKEKLIDSIKLGYPFGSILLYKNEDNTYQLIDGLQRVSTIYEYLHTPAKFFRKSDISNVGIDKIFQLLNLSGNEEAIKDKILDYIQKWVLENHKTMEEVKHIKASHCALYLQQQFPTCSNDSIVKIISILEVEFESFQKDCEILANMEVPAIVYEGDASSLPEVFNRINSKGTTLSKYQILSATWTAYEYNITANELNPIFEYVDKFYVSILNDQFEIEGYNHADINESGKLNFYQIMYGFSKLLSNKFPYLFTKSSKKEGVESSGFNLVNCCLGNKNNNIAELPKILNNTFNNDKQINDFLVNILHSTNDVYKLLKPYLEFKLNKRDSIEIYHTEFQICSMIANYFNNKYVTYTYDDKGNIIGRNIKIKETNKNFKEFQKDFKDNAFKKYLIDIIEDSWKGSGDSKMDRIALDKNYYSSEINVTTMENSLDYWFNQMNTNRQEYKKVQVPKAPEKLLLSIIYGHLFTAIDQNDENNYDIEHLAPKGKMKILLSSFNNGEEDYKLPISSFGNLCLLKEGINRKKKDKTLYEDTIYLNKLSNKHISIEEIETKFTFTTEKDLEWINKDYHNYSDLKYDYTSFINKRFKEQKKLILQNLFPNEDLTYISNEPITYITTGYVNQSNSGNSIIKPSFVIHDKNNELGFYDILDKLNGWQKDVFLIINEIDKETFTLKDLYAYKDELQSLHPNNTTIDARIRATLQQLRDLGIIEFVSKGVYKRLWIA